MEGGGIRDACQGAVGLLCGTDRGFRNVGKPQSDVREMPKRIHTRFKTQRKFEIKDFNGFPQSFFENNGQ